MQSITQGDLPAWYELAYKKGTLIVRLPNVVYDTMMAEAPTFAPYRQYFEKEFGFDSDLLQPELPTFPNCWTFGLSKSVYLLRQKGSVELWANLATVVPSELGEDAPIFYDEAFRLTATLSLLFQMLFTYEGEVPAGKPQLLTIRCISVEKERHGSAVSVEISPALTRWLACFNDDIVHPGITKAMRAAWRRMDHAFDAVLQNEFYAVIRQPHWLNLTVPGDSCGLDPREYMAEEGKGFTLLPHNVDSPCQGLSLLAGLAKTYELARRDGF